MILKNYWKWMEALTQVGTVSTWGPGINVGLKDITGANALIVVTSATSYDAHIKTMNNFNLKSNYNVRIGTGQNELSSEDYCLKNDITSQITNFNVTLNTSADDNHTRVITVTGQNFTNNEMVINEVAYTKTIYDGYDAVSTKEVMLAIAQLENPITVPSGSSFVVTVEWIEA